jgi:hypothetical protein
MVLEGAIVDPDRQLIHMAYPAIVTCRLVVQSDLLAGGFLVAPGDCVVPVADEVGLRQNRVSEILSVKPVRTAKTDKPRTLVR